MYAWAMDNGFTPHLVVAADQPGVTVPRPYVKDGRITLDISPMAVRNLNLDDDPIFFSARFGGVAFDIVVPSGAVLALVTRETGEGLSFGEPEPTPVRAGKTEDEPPPPSPKPGGRPKLRVVK
ncbi:MAG: ClpXP protease specificity-enhancing factor [Nevskia sp.]|nr:ClpXP protease specificity-enhancing factor [Nevskia sp.]